MLVFTKIKFDYIAFFVLETWPKIALHLDSHYTVTELLCSLFPVELKSLDEFP